jgi:hypothetical protein
MTISAAPNMQEFRETIINVAQQDAKQGFLLLRKFDAKLEASPDLIKETLSVKIELAKIISKAALETGEFETAVAAYTWQQGGDTFDSRQYRAGMDEIFDTAFKAKNFKAAFMASTNQHNDSKFAKEKFLDDMSKIFDSALEAGDFEMAFKAKSRQYDHAELYSDKRKQLMTDMDVLSDSARAAGNFETAFEAKKWQLKNVGIYYENAEIYIEKGKQLAVDMGVISKAASEAGNYQIASQAEDCQVEIQNEFEQFQQVQDKNPPEPVSLESVMIDFVKEGQEFLHGNSGTQGEIPTTVPIVQ